MTEPDAGAAETDTTKPVQAVVRECPRCGRAIGAMLDTDVRCPRNRTSGMRKVTA
jgi:hypothetical protein